MLFDRHCRSCISCRHRHLGPSRPIRLCTPNACIFQRTCHRCCMCGCIDGNGGGADSMAPHDCRYGALVEVHVSSRIRSCIAFIINALPAEICNDDSLALEYVDRPNAKPLNHSHSTNQPTTLSTNHSTNQPLYHTCVCVAMVGWWDWIAHNRLEYYHFFNGVGLS
jgi:hypothetical protein